MRITWDFCRPCARIPAEDPAKATGLEVHLYGSLSAAGRGHGTERPALAGLLGKEPATVDPLFLDGIAADPERAYPVTFGEKTFQPSQTSEGGLAANMVLC